MQSDAEILLRSQEAGVIQAEHESLKQRVKMLEDSLNVCFLIFTKMGFQPNEIRMAKQTVRAGHVPDLSVPFHLMDPSSLSLDFSFQMPAPAFGAHFTSPTSSHGASASSSSSSSSIGNFPGGSFPGGSSSGILPGGFLTQGHTTPSLVDSQQPVTLHLISEIRKRFILSITLGLPRICH